MTQHPRRVLLFERNRALAARIGRVLRAACDLANLQSTDDPHQARAALTPELDLIACDASDLDLVREWSELSPHTKLLVWSQAATGPLVELAQHDLRLSNLVGWPSFESMPRPWELLSTTRRLLGAPAPKHSEWLSWGATHYKFRPHTTDELAKVVITVAEIAERAGQPRRSAQRTGIAAHELLMNAMYDAPVDQYGEPRFAFARDSVITLEGHEAPTLRIGTDGEKLVLQVSDPFGRLERATLYRHLVRGQAAGGATLDTSGGGAGLGLARIHASGIALVVDVTPNERTTITLVTDLDLRAREARALPLSLHWFGAL